MFNVIASISNVNFYCKLAVMAHSISWFVRAHHFVVQTKIYKIKYHESMHFEHEICICFGQTVIWYIKFMIVIAIIVRN